MRPARAQHAALDEPLHSHGGNRRRCDISNVWTGPLIYFAT